MDTCDYVDFGYVEETESWRLKSHLMPSKIGGKPAWLSLKPLPSADQLKCGNCAEPCIFLLQVYSPIELQPEAFHRTIFVFICRNPDCHKTENYKESIIVFRSSLPKVNSFYSCEPPNYEMNDEKIDHPCAIKTNKLCVVCGCLATNKCSQCHLVNYCCKTHQVYHWKAGHKNLCKQTSDTTGTSNLLFKELGICMREDMFEDDDDDDDDEALGVDSHQLKAITNIEKDLQENTFDKHKDDNVSKNLDNNDDGLIDDNIGSKIRHSKTEIKEWREIIERVGTQCSLEEIKRMQFNASTQASLVQYFLLHKPVIKYARGGTMILKEEGCVEIVGKESDQQTTSIQARDSGASDGNKSESKIPNCEKCDGERIFEFMIMPHLLSILANNDLRDNVSWVAVFTCKNNCLSSEKNDNNNCLKHSYIKEFAWKHEN